uniref:Uncharacterized protein n=1 Tax=Trichogramma kaykai TaxID=54128 RepID=A0ABD2VUZ3_9HYME
MVYMNGVGCMSVRAKYRDGSGRRSINIGSMHTVRYTFIYIITELARRHFVHRAVHACLSLAISNRVYLTCTSSLPAL